MLHYLNIQVPPHVYEYEYVYETTLAHQLLPMLVTEWLTLRQNFFV